MREQPPVAAAASSRACWPPLPLSSLLAVVLLRGPLRSVLLGAAPLLSRLLDWRACVYNRGLVLAHADAARCVCVRVCVDAKGEKAETKIEETEGAALFFKGGFTAAGFLAMFLSSRPLSQPLFVSFCCRSPPHHHQQVGLCVDVDVWLPHAHMHGAPQFCRGFWLGCPAASAPGPALTHSGVGG